MLKPETPQQQPLLILWAEATQEQATEMCAEALAAQQKATALVQASRQARQTRQAERSMTLRPYAENGRILLANSPVPKLVCPTCLL